MDKLKKSLRAFFLAVNEPFLHYQQVVIFALRVSPTWVWTRSFLVGPTSQAFRSSVQTAPSSSSSSSAGSAWMKENFQKPKTLHWRSVRHSCRCRSFILLNFKDFCSPTAFLSSFKVVSLKPENICNSEPSTGICLMNCFPWIETSPYFPSVPLFSLCCGDCNHALMTVQRPLDVTCVSLEFFVACVSVHISADPWCHPRACGSLPVSSAAAGGRVS